jgi:HK97 family phage major capsid protein
LANNAFYNEMRQDSATQNAFWEGIGGDRPATLLGRPVYESEDMDSVVGAGEENYMAIIGDFSNYVIADRMGMQVETIPHLFGTPNNRPTGNRGFFAMARTGADSVNDGAFSMLNVT